MRRFAGCTALLGLMLGLGCQRQAAEPQVVFFATDTDVVDASACQRGDVKGCELVANQLSISTLPGDRARAVALFESLCGQKSLLGCYAAGAAFVAGDVVPADRAKGLRLLKQGCDLGHHWSCQKLNEAP